MEKREIPLFVDDLGEEGVVAPGDWSREWFGQKKVKLLLPERAILAVRFPPKLVAAIRKRGKREFGYAKKQYPKIVEIETGASPPTPPICCVIIRGGASSIAAATLEEIMALGGVKEVILLAAAGTLIEMPEDALILPTEAIRDEGTSYHYLPPLAQAKPSQRLQEKLKRSLQKHKFPVIQGKTWTTDAFYRTTPTRIKTFKSQGAVSVEMEAAGCFSTAQYRGLELGALLFPTDFVSATEKWRVLRAAKDYDYQKILQVVIDALSTF